MYEDYEQLKFSRRGLVLTVTMDNPPVNGVGHKLHDELARVFHDIRRDDGCNVVVLTGEGRCFSAGGDLNQMLGNLEDGKHILREMGDAPEIAKSLLALEKPTIAHVNGHAMGLGASLALLCDVVFANENARIADPHVLVGLSAGDGGALIWPHLIGYARARHHLFTGEALTGRDAAEIGLIHKALPEAELAAAVAAYADKLAALPFQALSATKVSINMALCRQANADVDSHVRLETRAMMSNDHREALLAMIEKREPRFDHGRG
ncbi:enoyl-CoA hydratase [Rhizorhabdus wittichii DC-6]|nr:enoyl-CoA hydratase [Rhizorhabdus wittichii DC-6]